jgi:hypothetical protein
LSTGDSAVALALAATVGFVLSGALAEGFAVVVVEALAVVEALVVVEAAAGAAPSPQPANPAISAHAQRNAAILDKLNLIFIL